MNTTSLSSSNCFFTVPGVSKQNWRWPISKRRVCTSEQKRRMMFSKKLACSPFCAAAHLHLAFGSTALCWAKLWGGSLNWSRKNNLPRKRRNCTSLDDFQQCGPLRSNFLMGSGMQEGSSEACLFPNWASCMTALGATTAYCAVIPSAGPFCHCVVN